MSTEETTKKIIRNAVSNDPIADFLTRIRNAVILNRAQVAIPFSKLKHSLANILKEEGYLNDVQIINEEKASTKSLVLDIRYHGKMAAISGLRKISKPGLRKYSKAKYAPRVYSGLGISILTTNKGLLTDRKARELKLGGEVLCQVW
jgi:small subunit ribosomal protein S8